MVFRADPVSGAQTYVRAVRARNGLIYGLADGKYYAFNPETRAVLFTGDLPVKSLYFPQSNGDPVGPRGLLYGLGDGAVFSINPADNRVEIVARDPSLGSPGKRGKRGAFGFFVTQEGVLYYGSGATLMRCKLPP